MKIGSGAWGIPELSFLLRRKGSFIVKIQRQSFSLLLALMVFTVTAFTLFPFACLNENGDLWMQEDLEEQWDSRVFWW